MRCVGAVYPIEHAGVDHHARTLAVFLGGLEYRAHFAVELVGHLREYAERSELHGDVAVVPAGVHDPRALAGEGNAGALGNSEGVDIGPNEKAPPRRAVLPVGVGRSAGKRGDEACVKRAFVGDAHGVELAGDRLGGAHLLQAQLRMLVEIAALRDDVRLCRAPELLDARGRIGRSLRLRFRCRSCLFACHAPSCSRWRSRHRLYS